jgi:hypothetical protein
MVARSGVEEGKQSGGVHCGVAAGGSSAALRGQAEGSRDSLIVKRHELRKNSGYRMLHTVPRLWLTTGRSTIQRVPARGTTTRLEYQLGQALPAAALQENCSKKNSTLLHLLPRWKLQK